MDKAIESSLVLSVEDVSITVQQKELFRNVNFEIRKGEHLMLVGPSGSGKTTFLKAIEGRSYISQGKIIRHFYEAYKSRHQLEDPLFSFTNLIVTVPERAHFKNASNTTDLYYQQRYNSMDSEDAPTVQAYLDEIFSKSPVADKKWDVLKALSLLNLGELAEKQVIKLSNGETRRLLIAAALVKNPTLLLMDNPLVGLDVDTRGRFDSLLKAIIESGITIIMTGLPDFVPSAITHVGVIGKNNLKLIPHSIFEPHRALEKNSSPREEIFNSNLLQQLLPRHQNEHFDYIARLKSVTVKYGAKTILKDLDWSIRQGERWVLSGPNGSGKTTLLSLINGDNPQAYGNDIILFDRKRGSGESIWDIKKKIGFVSPELHQYFPTDSSCLQVIESGFYDTPGLFRKSDPEKREMALKWAEVFNLATITAQPFRSVSASHQRILLLARALVKNPPLLILDEPCQGLDAAQQNYFKEILEKLCEINNTTIIYVTHHQEEIPSGFDLVFKL